MPVPEEFADTTKIVNTTLQPKVTLSVEAESALNEIMSVEEARRLLDQTGQGYLVNIPLMIALSMGESPENPYRVDCQKLFDVFATNGDRVREKIQKSYDEVVGMVNLSEIGNVQGVKQLTECKKKLIDSIGALSEDKEYTLLKEVVRLFVVYLQTAYVLMGRQH
jgi:hypothetical protein